MMEEEIKDSTIAVDDGGVEYDENFDSSCSTPYVSAPSSPTRGGFYYSAPASPMHFVLSSTASINSYPSAATTGEGNCSFEFDFCSTFPTIDGGAASADELFCNGQIRPMKLSSHLRSPKHLSPLIESDDAADEDPQTLARGRDLKFRTGSLRRRTRSMSPLRTSESFGEETDCKMRTEELIRKLGHDNEEEEKESSDTTLCPSRSSSAGRSSKRWVFLKEFLYRSKSEGRNDEGSNHKFWSSLSFSPGKEKKPSRSKDHNQEAKKASVHRNGSVSKTRRGPSPSPHEIHYTANRAQSEEMRKKTFLPYRQGLLGCLGFSSKGYGAVNGLARALNPVYSR